MIQCWLEFRENWFPLSFKCLLHQILYAPLMNESEDRKPSIAVAPMHRRTCGW